VACPAGGGRAAAGAPVRGGWWGGGGGGAGGGGVAMREVPEGLKLACHRVVRSDGALSPKRVFAGRQRGLLEREGVVFRENGRVDMGRCEWNGGGGRRAVLC